MGSILSSPTIPSSGRLEHAPSEEIDVCSPIHLPFQEFETCNLTFYLPLAPRKRQRGFDGGVIALDARSKSPQLHRGTLVGPEKPAIQAVCLSLLDHLHKVLSQLIEVLQINIGVADALDECLLVCRELRLVFNEQPGRVAG